MGDVTSMGQMSRKVGPNNGRGIVSCSTSFFGGLTYNALLDFSHLSLLPWYPGGNVRCGGLESPMFLYVSDGHQNRADDHKSFLGLSVFEYHFDPGFKSAAV